MEEVVWLPASEQARLIRERALSPVELTAAYLERIAKVDGAINAYVTVDAEGAMRAAEEAERHAGSEGAPPFLGVPISIKDLNETRGLRTTFSCKAFADYVPETDDGTVRRIRDAGFVVLGKTNTPELGTIPVTESELNGVCRNPYDTALTPGGSSGGGAAALAAGLCPISLGGDGGGSIRIPASCCGLFGLKPARGRVSSGPLAGESMHGLATHGPISRTVRDAAALLDVMSGYEIGDPYWAPPPERSFVEEVGAPPGRLRVALTTAAPNDAQVNSEVERAAREGGLLLESLGHFVEEVDPHWVDPSVQPAFTVLWQTFSATTPISDLSMLEPLNRTLTEAGLRTSSHQYVRAMETLYSYARRVVALFEQYDALLTPTIALPPVPTGWLFEEDDPWLQFERAGDFVPFTPPFNLTGQPAASVPLHFSGGGLPIGVQLVTRPADEVTLIRLCAQLEEARPWAGHRPQT